MREREIEKRKNELYVAKLVVAKDFVYISNS